MGKFADRYFQIHPWVVAEDGFDPKHSQAAESIFSLGNEYTGLRGYFDAAVIIGLKTLRLKKCWKFGTF